ncbi:glycosyltransferase family protein [Bergeyella sp. RCAD1439]|uniref:glycosyltransferase family protein n=1 Tax=Bergeyella anatis TaxID=3113737 RepID=UPI002E18B581|nr:glycosyltransferase family protein [Bergeyella sp. RCAD1439]
MKILYAIQGTGNGHVSRAREIIPHLKKQGELDLLVSGSQADVGLDEEVKYRLVGAGFVFGRNGGIDFGETWKRLDFSRFWSDVKRLPVQDYDLVINDFEPVCAWSCRLKAVHSVGLSHQSAFKSKLTPQLGGFRWGRAIMNCYAPTSSFRAFHFCRYDDFIHTPVIRSEVRKLKPEDWGYYTVYLPAYSDEFILGMLTRFSKIRWQVFSKHSSQAYERENVEVFPIENQRFVRSLAYCSGVLTGGGFEGPSEALFLGKKLLVVPMKNQYEQQCNALALEAMGVPVIWSEDEFEPKLSRWIGQEERVEVDYPDETEWIVENIVRFLRS